MEEPNMPRPDALKRALPILIFTLIGALIIGFLALRSINILNTTGPGSTDFSLLAPVCGETGNPSAAVFDRQTVTHPAVIARETDNGWQIDLDPVPAEFQPQTIGEVQLILCVSPAETTTIPICDTGESIQMEQAAVRLVSARTGATVDNDRIGFAGECWPDQETEPAGVSDNDLWAWIRPYVMGGLE